VIRPQSGGVAHEPPELVRLKFTRCATHPPYSGHEKKTNSKNDSVCSLLVQQKCLKTAQCATIAMKRKRKSDHHGVTTARHKRPV